MTVRTQPGVLRQLRQSLLRQHDVAASDAELLARYVDRRDEQAFAALVHRHGPMVLGVCRRVLGNAADADDAFQATFLVLVVKAATIRSRALLGNFLYGVAYNTARKAQAMNRTRRAKEAQARPEVGEASCPETQAVVDAELAALPEMYRSAIVACDLEGKTVKDAAARLGVPQGTLAARLRRGRALLAQRLQARGVGLTPGVFATPAVSAALVGATVEAGARLLAGQAVSESISLLVDGVLKSMLLTKLKTSLVVFVVLFLGLGGSLLSQSKSPTPAAGGSAVTSEDSLKNTLLALDKHLWEAWARGDWQERQKFLADDFVSLSFHGKATKADVAERDKKHRCKDWTIRDVEVARLSKDVAVLSYVYGCKVVSNDGQELEARNGHRVSCGWANRNGGWVLVYCHDEYGRPATEAGYDLRSRAADEWLPILRHRQANQASLRYIDLVSRAELGALKIDYQIHMPLPVGEWAVEFSNGVKQVTTFAKGGTVTVAEPTRKAKGKADAKDGAIVVKYEDGRVERWARTGNRMVVEHWFPATEYPAGRPVLGVADSRPALELVKVPMKHVDAENAVRRVTAALGDTGVKITADARANSVLIHGTEEQVKRVKLVLAAIDAVDVMKR